MVSPATKKADLGGIDTPPSANYLVVHNPAKCSVFWRSTQGHGEISFPFGNHAPPHPLFSLRSQTATSQLAGFRKKAGGIFWSYKMHVSRQSLSLIACCTLGGNVQPRNPMCSSRFCTSHCGWIAAELCQQHSGLSADEQVGGPKGYKPWFSKPWYS